MEPAWEIEGAEQVTSALGGWPTFEDGEIIRLWFPEDGASPPALHLALYLFREKPERGPCTEERINDRHLVTLRSENPHIIARAELDVPTDLFELTISPVAADEHARACGRRFRVDMDCALATVAYFCDRISVVAVEPLTVGPTGLLLLNGEPLADGVDPEAAAPSAMDSRLTQMIEQVCQRPGMLAQTPYRFTNAASLLTGYAMGLTDAGVLNRSEGLVAFRNWLARRYWRSQRIARNLVWDSYIKCAATDDDARFALLRELYREFLRTRSGAAVDDGLPNYPC